MGLWQWLKGEDLEVEILETRTKYVDDFGPMWMDHTLVQLPNHRRVLVKGHLGKPGEKVIINSWSVWVQW